MKRKRRFFFSQLLAWIPDLSGLRLRTLMLLGLVLSILFHAFLFTIFSLLSRVFPEPRPLADERRPEIEITVEPRADDALPLPRLPPPPTIDSRGLQLAKEAPPDPKFQSDENLQAGSELPPTGSAPLPTQSGNDRVSTAFQTHKAQVGPIKPSTETPSAPSPAAPAATPPPMIARSTPPPPTPAPKLTEKSSSPAPHTAPLDLVKLDQATENQIALAPRVPIRPTPPPDLDRLPAPTPVPRPISATPPHPSSTPPALHAMLATPALVRPPAPKSNASYLPDQRQNRIEGSISNRGRKGVSAMATPLAKYQKLVNDAIGARWHYYVRNRLDLFTLGTARISFYLTDQGRISALRVEDNTSNQSFADVCLRAVRDAEIPPPPANSLEPFKDGRLEYTIDFTLYPF